MLYAVYSTRTLNDDIHPRFFSDVESALKHQKSVNKYFSDDNKVYVHEIVTKDIFGDNITNESN